MRLRPTPRTDQNEEGIRHFDLYGFESSLAPATYEWPTFARQLERELAEMEEQCESWANQSMSWKLKADVLARKLEESEKERRVLSDAAKHLNDRMAELQRERNEAREQLDSWQRLALSSEMLRKKTEEQRNKLAEAAKAVVDRWETPLWKDAPHTGLFIRALADALDAIERGANE